MTIINRISLVAALLLVLILYSCKKDKLGISQESLSGYWIEKEPSIIIQYAGTNHEFQFNNDKTFTLKRYYWTDVITMDSCYNSHTDFIMGTYSFNSNQFEFIGKYSDSLFTIQQMSNCGEIDYLFQTNYEFKSDTLTLNADKELYFKIALYKQ